MEIEITSASKSTEKLLNAAASLYVITDEDIRRSGASNVAGFSYFRRLGNNVEFNIEYVPKIN